MQPRSFESRTTAHKAAVKLRAEKSDRLVLACGSCGEVREALTEVLAAERGR